MFANVIEEGWHCLPKHLATNRSCCIHFSLYIFTHDDENKWSWTVNCHMATKGGPVAIYRDISSLLAIIKHWLHHCSVCRWVSFLPFRVIIAGEIHLRFERKSATWNLVVWVRHEMISVLNIEKCSKIICNCESVSYLSFVLQDWTMTHPPTWL